MGKSSDERQPFESALAPLLRPAYQLAFGMLQSREEAEDAVQEAAMRAWMKRANLREGSELRPWFLAIVANQCRTVVRGRWWTVLKRPELPSPAAGTEPALDEVVQGIVLRNAIRRLPHRQRLVIVLHFYLDLTFDEVAAVTRESTAAVKSRIYRAARELAPLVSAREGFGLDGRASLSNS
ncbi:MAG: RNA polymerase sigma factor [Chloroflexi bacterium]|nr:MAG: RNA polymerase sigma factor [Chloroflexota bacterium]